MTRVWLIRHCEPAEEVRGRCYGSLDVGLSEKGRDQMKDVATYRRSESITRIYSSPRSRAQESARILAMAVPRAVEVIDDLREINFGEFEGLLNDEIAADYSDLYREWMENPTKVRFPKGESFQEMRLRVLNACAKRKRNSPEVRARAARLRRAM